MHEVIHNQPVSKIQFLKASERLTFFCKSRWLADWEKLHQNSSRVEERWIQIMGSPHFLSYCITWLNFHRNTGLEKTGCITV